MQDEPKSETTTQSEWEPAGSVEKSEENEEKSKGGNGKEEKKDGEGGDSYAELPGMLIGKSKGSFGGAVTATIQLLGGSTGELVLNFPNEDAAKNIPDMHDKKGKPVPPIPVKIKVMPGEGAPPPGGEKEEEEEEEENGDDEPKDQAAELSKRDSEASGRPPAEEEDDKDKKDKKDKKGKNGEASHASQTS